MKRLSFGVGCILLCVLGALTLFAQGQVPPRPQKYHATLRYRILAPRDQHVALYDEMIAALEKLDFEFLDEREPTDRMDPSKNELRGLIRSEHAAKLPSVPHIAGVLLIPDARETLDKLMDPVRVRLELASGLPPDRQRELAIQTRLLLRELGFIEAPGYDHRDAAGRPYSRLVGTLPREQLDILIKDLRTQPGGWFAPRIPLPTLPSPLRQVNPIRIAEVLTDTAPIVDVAPPAERNPAYLDKIGPGLWEKVNVKDGEKDGTLDQVERVQVLFAGNPSADLLQRIMQQVAPTSSVEGILGSYVWAEVRLGDVKALAELPEVLGVRLPPLANVAAEGLPPDFEPAKALVISGVSELHKQGHRGKGVRLGVIDTDFRGWEQLVGKKELPASTKLVDLTMERTRDFSPLPSVPGNELGHGTQLARAASVAAPEAELVLIRVAEADARLIDEVAGYFRGGLTSLTLERRLGELRLEDTLLRLDRARLLKERAAILDDFTDETETFANYGFLGPVYGWIFSERDWHRQRLANQDRREREYTVRERRYWKLIEQIQGLKGIALAVTPFSWNDSYALAGVSPLSRALDGHAKDMLWFVPAGNTAGQSWQGPFRDIDQNGVLEFTPVQAKLPANRWTSELNFLSWQPHGGKTAADLPEKARLRLALQWREPHDPDYYPRPGETDYFRKPLADLRLALLRQRERDPEGNPISADSFEVVARSPLVPTRLDHHPGGTVYEQVLEWTVDKAGKYAVRLERTPPTQWLLIKEQDTFRFVRLEGLMPTGIRPLEAPTLPALEKTWELLPRLSVTATNEAARRGRVLLADFSTDEGSIGSPADARLVISVGAANLAGARQPYSAAGTPPSVGLARRPHVYACDAVRSGTGGAWGTSLAAAFAAGSAASLLSSGTTAEQIRAALDRGEPNRLIWRVEPRKRPK